MDYVLLSPNDGELLKKAHQMLLEGGVKDDAGWNMFINPDNDSECIALNVMCSGSLYMSFHNHDCKEDNTTPIRLAPENLTESVATVLNAYKAAQP